MATGKDTKVGSPRTRPSVSWGKVWSQTLCVLNLKHLQDLWIRWTGNQWYPKETGLLKKIVMSNWVQQKIQTYKTEILRKFNKGAESWQGPFCPGGALCYPWLWKILINLRRDVWKRSCWSESPKNQRSLLLHLSPTPHIHYIKLIESMQPIQTPTRGSQEDTSAGGFRMWTR